MSEDKPIPDTPEPSMKVAAPAPEKRRGSRSAFAPIVLIAAGVFFLLDNLGVVSALNWEAAWRFWPLALIFLGLNVLVVQFPRPVGTILSALVALAAVAVFGWLLLSGPPSGFLRSLGVPAPRELQAEDFALTPGAAKTAAITLHMGNYPARVEAGSGADLVSGTIWTRTGLDMQPTSDAAGHFDVTIGEEPGGFSFNPGDWIDGADHTWAFLLSPDLPIDLRLEAGNGSLSADLAGLALSNLVIEAANGSVTADLPAGAYDVRLNGGNGGIDLTLPDSGPREVRVDSGNGGVDLTLPDGVEARVEYDTGNGSVNVDGRFERVSGDNDEGVYETAGYEAGDGVLFVVETGNGSVEITN